MSMEKLAKALKRERPAPRFVNGKVVSKANGVAKVDIGGEVVDVPNAGGVGAGSVVQLAIQEGTASVSDVITGASPKVPVGMVAMWITATPPPGWLILDGTSFSGSQYPELQAVLGGTTLPNFNDRAPVGSSGSKALKSTGGNASISLGVNELPPHTHTVSNIGIGAFPTGTGAQGYYPSGTDSATTSTGSGNAFSIQNPYVAVRFIIFAGGAAS